LRVLILYTSYTGNTEKVALRIRDTFKTNDHETDIYKIDNNIDLEYPPFNYEDYGFLCVGSPVRRGVASTELVNMMVLHRGRKEENKVPGLKKGVVFATYGAAHLGPKEAEVALKTLESCLEQLKFKCVGSFSCPGKKVPHPIPDWYQGDNVDRPNASDLDNAERFVQSVLRSV
jgi:flavodoxin